MPFLKMEVIHSLGVTSFNQLGRSGAVGNFLTFAYLLIPRSRLSGKGRLGILGLLGVPFDSQEIEEIFYRKIRGSQALIFFAWNLLSG